MKTSLVLLMTALLLMGCTVRQKATKPATSPADFVATTLGAAAEQAHGDLAMLAKLRGQGVQPILPPPDPSLERPLSVSWTGPASGVLKEICLMVGYRYEEMGKPTAQQLPVVINGLNKPAYTLLEDVAWQVQPQAMVRVDAVNHVITLAHSSMGGK